MYSKYSDISYSWFNVIPWTNKNDAYRQKEHSTIGTLLTVSYGFIYGSYLWDIVLTSGKDKEFNNVHNVI